MLPVEVMDFPESDAFCVRIPRPDLAAYRSLEELAGGVTDAEALCRMALNLSSLCCQMGFYLLNLDAISRRDVLLRPEDGSLRVLHGDNVMYDSGWIPEDGNRCRAPELGTAVRRPDPCTDSWQLAAWLLLLFTGALPTAGETGTFVFGPDAPAEPPEEPLRTQRQRWDRLPPVLRQAFLDTFTRTDADSRERRTTPWAWNRLFQELPETLVPCPRCGRKTFGAGRGCLFCGAEPTPGFPE